MMISRLEEEQKSYVIVIDRRMDKWSSVRLLLSYLTVSVNLDFTSYQLSHIHANVHAVLRKFNFIPS